MNKKQTSPKVAKIASKVLNDPKANKVEKKLSGSALSQAKGGKKK